MAENDQRAVNAAHAIVKFAECRLRNETPETTIAALDFCELDIQTTKRIYLDRLDRPPTRDQPNA